MKETRFPFRILIIVFLFSIAMGYMESAVVIYLREVLYPQGFGFPLAPIENKLAVTEIFREAATLFMLISIGTFAGRTLTEKFAFFLFSFAVWDIFYYIFLKILIHWPDSIFTWDILFLIPVTWTGPVITPVIISSTMIVLSLFIIYFTSEQLPYFDTGARIKPVEWFFLISGSLIVFIAFIVVPSLL